MDLATALTYPNGTLKVIACVRGADRLPTWTDNGTSWTAALSQGAGAELLVVAIEVDGAEISEALWSWDVAAGTVTVDDDAFEGGDPHFYNVTAAVELYLASEPTESEGRLYRGEIEGVPRVEWRVEEVFGGDVPQLGGGSVNVANASGLVTRYPQIAWRTMELDLGAEV